MRMRSRKNIRMFKYGGAVSQNLLVLDTADIKFVDFFNSFNQNEFDGQTRKIVNKLEAKIYSENIQETITFSDDRLVFIANKLMTKFPNSRIYYGLNEWTIVYRFLIAFYDKSIPNIDSLIRFINLYIGSNFTDNDDMTADEVEELLEISDSIRGNVFVYEQLLPKFVIDAISGNIQVTDKQNKKVKDKKADALFNQIFESIGI